jgi:ubiquinone/menaquinone biosynthesis C-methylase UbiE
MVDRALSTDDVMQERAAACVGLSGRVLEIGFGSGRNVRHYPAEVQRVLAVGPETGERDMAERRIARSSVPIEFLGLDGERQSLEDASVDHVLITWTLCTSPDVVAALDEMHRVLRPGGTLNFVEHGLSPDTKTAVWQRRLNPVQKRLFGGCHLDRPIDALVSVAGLALGDVDRYYAPGPKPLSYFYAGTATKE